ncbi:cold shock domain-containing protein CG9705 [Anthonomus grandis grandis]|uniref:cold shock domain-containing protein CG9705 n=1 Tax=Anthonomus grandis grandis TaxID=2921223 RepID=UPI0021656C70|nr:cold shock domain-containing protein CG9705 [Anthonomus grandis grandis]
MSGDNLSHLIPSPLITKRTRTASTCEKIEKSKILYGTIKSFCREKGHGFITAEDGSGDIFAHISDIEDEYVPLPGDRVKYQLCPIPPKFEKYQAVHVHIVNLKPEIHKKWEQVQ